MSFEQQYKELQGIVTALETGESSVEEAMGQFKKGMTLLKSLKSQLEKVENELREIDTEVATAEAS